MLKTLLHHLTSGSLLRHGSRFLVSGVLITLIDYACFQGACALGLAGSLARMVGFVVAFLISFVIHHWWTFESKQHWTTSFMPYLQARVGSFLIAQLAFMLMHDALGWGPNLSFALQLPIQPVANFLLGHFYVFRGRGGDARVVGQRWILEVVLLPAFLFIALAYPFRNPDMQAPVWMSPYLAGAANWSPGQEWKVPEGATDTLKSMTKEERWDYSFKPASEGTKLHAYSAHDPGWMWVLWGTRTAFPFLSDLWGAVVLAGIVHLALCSWVLAGLRTGIPRLLFISLYVANPFIIYLMTFPYYYSWQAFPSLIALGIWLHRTRLKPWMAPALGLMLALCVAVRPNVVFVAFAALLLFSYFSRRWLSFAGIAVFLACFAMIPKGSKMLWHTVYAGIGAYPTAGKHVLSDDWAYECFKRRTGIVMEMDFGGNYYDSAVRQQYNEVLREESLAYFKAHPIEPVRNAALNTLVGCAGGYLPKMPYALYWAQAAAGFVFLGLLAWRRQWGVITGMGLSIGCISLYYPPLLAYMVGGYAFIVFGGIVVLLVLLERYRAFKEHRPPQHVGIEATEACRR